jgi:hypothetical protein
MELEEGEVVILDEGRTGLGGMTLALTNKRLLWLQKDQIQYELRLENISQVYPNTRMFANLTEMKIRTRDGNEYGVNFEAKGKGLFLGGTGYVAQNARTMTDRYVAAVNKLLNEQSFATAGTGRVFCRYCGEKNQDDAVFCEKCGKRIGKRALKIK